MRKTFYNVYIFIKNAMQLSTQRVFSSYNLNLILYMIQGNVEIDGRIKDNLKGFYKPLSSDSIDDSTKCK